MNTNPLDHVLACPGLPTLPGVAVKVLELTRDPHVSIGNIAKTVRNDPAISTRVLKIVNSSFTGLTTRCPSISRALSLLGLNTVKSIVLGFSIVDCTKTIPGQGKFNMEGYWKRAVFSAAGARTIAIHTKLWDPEEAFLGALLQDIGVLASWVALKAEYGDVIAPIEDHDESLVAEQNALGFDHTEAGAKLAAKWRLPQQLIECISMHHTPDRCAPQFGQLLRCVRLGGMAAEALGTHESKRKLGAYLITARDWFKIDSATARDLLPSISKAAKEIAGLLDVKTGESNDVAELLSQAQELMMLTQEELQKETINLLCRNDELARLTVTDSLTGCNNRKFFDRELASTFESCKEQASPLSVLFIDGDRFKSVNDTHGHKAGDAVLIALAKSMQRVVGERGFVCRYGGEEFAIVLPGLEIDAAAGVSEEIRTEIESTAINLEGTGAKVPYLHVTISVGVSTCLPGRDATNVETLVQQADQSVYVAKKTGRNKVVCWGSFDPQEQTSGEDAAHPAAGAVTPLPESLSSATSPAPAVIHATTVGSGSVSAPNRTAPPRASTPVAAQAKDPQIPQGKPETGPRILVIDDDPFALKLLSVLICKRGDFVIATASSGEDAVKQLTAGDLPQNMLPDMILVDGKMPGMSGLQFIKWSKANARTASIPVVMITNICHDSVRSSSLAAGASLFIEKNDFCVSPDAWISKLLEILKSRRIAA